MRFVTVRCGDVTLTEGRMGRVGDRVAVRVAKPLRKPKTTFAMFEKADESSKRVEAIVSNGFGLMIESLVAVLLLLTIGYSVLLNKRLKRLKADELALKATISELITATEIAERAIGGLKVTVRECDQSLGERLRNAGALLGRDRAPDRGRRGRLASGVEPQVAAGRRGRVQADAPAAPAIAPMPRRRCKAAQAFAARARNRTQRRRRMNRFLREFRLIPVVLFATASLLALKIGGLVDLGGYTLAEPAPGPGADDLRPRRRRAGQRSWAQDVLGYPRRHRLGREAQAAGQGCRQQPARGRCRKRRRAALRRRPGRTEARCGRTAAARRRRPNARCSSACRSAARSSSSARASSTFARAW